MRHRPLAAERLVDSRPAALFAFLSDLRRHWELLPGAVEVLGADEAGAVIRVHGPLGIRRTLRTRVTAMRAPHRLAGRASGPRTTALVSWSLTPDGERTRVRLAVELERASLRDRLLLAGGGAVWLRRRFAIALARLESAVVPPRTALTPVALTTVGEEAG